MARHIYVHNPFCARKCPYCDFYSVTKTSLCGEFYHAATFVGGLFTDKNIDNWNSLSRKGRKALETVFDSMSGVVTFISEISDSAKIDNKNLELNIASLHKLMDTVYTGDFEKASKNLDTFTKSAINVKSSIENLDKVLIKENDKRKKNIEDFGKSIEDLLKKFENADKSIGKLYSLVMALQTMDSNKVSSIIASMDLNNYKGGNNTIVPANVSAAQNNGITKEMLLTPADITDAIRDALDGMHISGGSMSENQSMDDAANAIIMALKDLRMDIDLNK